MECRATVHKNSLQEILSACERVNADILVLTETDERIHPSFRHCFQTENLTESTPVHYKPTENRVSIFTNYRCIKLHQTFDANTSLCAELETERGRLCVYGTIMGIEGNRRPSFTEDLRKQTADFKRLSAYGNAVCIIGDYNISFADNYYFTNDGRDTLLRSFTENHIQVLTGNVPECIDHVAVSRSFVGNANITIQEWNHNKKLSDHKGILVEIAFP